MRTITRVAGAALVLAFAQATAQNALVNADFDNGLALWKPAGSTGTATPDNANGSPGSPSIYLSLTDSSSSGLTEAVQQCVAVAANVNYTIAGRNLLDLPSTTAAGSAMFMLGQFFSSHDCSGVAISSHIANAGGTTAGTPLPYTTNTITVTSPVNAHSLKFTAQVQTGGINAGVAKGWVDRLSLTSTEALFVNGFDVPAP